MKVSFGGVDHEVPRFNMKQLREIARIGTSHDPADVPFQVLVIAFARATPPLSATELDEIEPLPGEFETVMNTVMELAGLVTKGEAQAPTETGQAAA